MGHPRVPVRPVGVETASGSVSRGSPAPLLAAGLVDDAGQRHLDVEWLGLTGRHELAFARGAVAGPAVETRLLASTVARIGALSPLTPELARALTRGDRQRLLLALVAGVTGDRLSVAVRCANPACRALADLALTVDALIGPAPRPPAPIRVATEAGDVVLREPTGADDEACAAISDPVERRAARWCRLVSDVAGRGPLDRAAWDALAPGVHHALALALADASAGPRLTVAWRCPACAARLDLRFDPLRMLVQATRIDADRLLCEVHALAWHYHWTEDQVLALPRDRRWRYVELIRGQIDGGGDSGDGVP